jgi:hypothetical protein
MKQRTGLLPPMHRRRPGNCRGKIPTKIAPVLCK